MRTASELADADGCCSSYVPKHIFHHFNPKAVDCDPAQLSTINASEDKPDAIAYALIYTANQIHWKDDDTIYIKSRLDLLPGYAKKKAVLVANHKEMDFDQVMDGISARLTETIKFGHYGIEDGPDVECFDEDGSISSLIVPGDWMSESFELPKAATVGTPSVQWAPENHEPFAVYTARGENPGKNWFKFIAWFFIEKIELFAANSVALARKMQATKWEADMNREW
ncbi:hypothetical protein C8A05DRAFT_15494 [Staphylotrichum tortipilum]|uniref:Uncharacterized protein n=1 Tax=Staphylotrichum tortipilum TaxID=2831512 RepID=A0AAN6MKU4_9PEZI|nr:hypothetical protein C8A05DRAFT_15494 [Staphylotrichum longicolle]